MVFFQGTKLLLTFVKFLIESKDKLTNLDKFSKSPFCKDVRSVLLRSRFVSFVSEPKALVGMVCSVVPFNDSLWSGGDVVRVPNAASVIFRLKYDKM